MERQCWASAYYLRRECLEIVVIPKEVEQKDLEGKVLSVLEKVGCRIDSDNMEDCHRLIRKSDNVKIKFSIQKYVSMSFGLKGIYKTLIWKISVFLGRMKFT